MILNKFPHFKQNNASDCGPTCLRIIAKYYGFNYSSEFLRRLCHISKGGVNLFEIKQAAESVGFNAVGVKLTFEQLVERKSFPCILYWNQRHFVVCYDIVKKVREKYRIKISDPASQRLSYTKKDFLSCWTGENLDENKLGVVLLLEPKEDYNYEEDKFNHKKRSLLSYLKYFNPYSLMIWQLLLSMLVGSVLQIIPPFLSQAVVDQGINAKDTDVILYIP